MAVFGFLAFLGFDSIGPAEFLVFCVVILIVVGPKRLPSAARKAGSVLSNLRRAADEFKNQLMTMDQPVNPPPPKTQDYIDVPSTPGTGENVVIPPSGEPDGPVTGSSPEPEAAAASKPQADTSTAVAGADKKEGGADVHASDSQKS